MLADEGDKQKKKRGKKIKERNPSLAKTLWSGLFGVDFAKAVMFQLLNDLLVFVQPQLLRYGVITVSYSQFKAVIHINFFHDFNSKVVPVQ